MPAWSTMPLWFKVFLVIMALYALYTAVAIPYNVVQIVREFRKGRDRK